MSPFLKTKRFKILVVVAVLLVLYALAGFVLAPKLIRTALIDTVRKSLELTPRVGQVKLNPFALQLEIQDFSLPDANGAELVGFKRLFVDVELASLWRRGAVFKTIQIDEPAVHAIVAADGSLNLTQLTPKNAPPPPPRDPNAPLPRVWIGAFTVAGGRVTYDDQRLADHFETRLEPVNFDLRDFSTGADGGLFDFSGASKLGEKIEWHGHVSVQPIQSDGDFTITGLRAHTLWEYAEQRLNFAVPTGTIDLQAHYRFALHDDVDLKLDLKQFRLTDLTVRPKDADVDWIALPELAVGATAVDLAGRDVQVESVVLSGLKVLAWVEADRSVNLARLGVVGTAATAPAAAVVPATAAPPASRPVPAAGPAPAWRVAVHEFHIKDASIAAEDRGVNPVAKVVLAPLSVDVAGASLDLSKPVQLQLNTGINGTAKLAVAGNLTPAPLGASLGVQLTQLDLTALQPYIKKFTAMTLLDGRLNGDLKVQYGGKPQVTVAGAVSVDKLHTVDDALHDDFLVWQRLDVQGLTYTQGPDRLEIARVSLTKPYARIIIESDESINVKRILAGPPGAAPVVVTQTPVGPAASVPPSGAAATKKAAPAMPMEIRTIMVADGKMNFSDLSVNPNFSTGVQALQGSLDGLSSRANSRAKIDLHGEVDQYSPVSITGEVNVLGPALYTDLAMSFRNMELSVFNPYSGKFAGYNITKGKLTTELHYKIEGRSLDAQHHVVIDQLEFGDKTASKDAVSLPVKLAVALLKDRHGVIDLNLPVNGSLDDPQFRLGPLIGKVLLNILEKSITAPFALLGSLFSGGPDLQFVDFQPGTADLDPAALDKVKAVAKALGERPQLKIEVPIAPVAELDRPVLVEARFNAAIAQQAAKMGGSQDATQQLAATVKAYAAAGGGDVKYPDDIVALKPKAEADKAKLAHVRNLLRKRITVSDDDLEALAQQRAQAIQHALLTDSELDPERVFLVVGNKSKAEGESARLELSLR